MYGFEPGAVCISITSKNSSDLEIDWAGGGAQAQIRRAIAYFGKWE
mgnify:CR=1 FL=1